MPSDELRAAPSARPLLRRRQRDCRRLNVASPIARDPSRRRAQRPASVRIASILRFRVGGRDMSARAFHAAGAVVLPASSSALRQRRARQRHAAYSVTRASAGGVVARWSIDARFGCKSQALALVRTCNQLLRVAGSYRAHSWASGSPTWRRRLEWRPTRPGYWPASWACLSPGWSWSCASAPWLTWSSFSARSLQLTTPLGARAWRPWFATAAQRGTPSVSSTLPPSLPKRFLLRSLRPRCRQL